MRHSNLPERWWALLCNRQISPSPCPMPSHSDQCKLRVTAPYIKVHKFLSRVRLRVFAAIEIRRLKRSWATLGNGAFEVSRTPTLNYQYYCSETKWITQPTSFTSARPLLIGSDFYQLMTLAVHLLEHCDWSQYILQVRSSRPCTRSCLTTVDCLS